ncbi:hypothetical protein GGI15_000131 [Coemansia interrupta]|uniref:Uncharacterized protein n=1 Tax=Coemansia interrupta TaxID=1126814 RepID=A0A9W8HLP6_9FUNG|nr:hypothetical protein GGI15_000131 [Coemansia interrupta]
MSSHVCKVLGRYWHMWQLKAPPARDIECWTGSETVSECSSSETDVGLDLGLSLNTDADFARDYGADIDFDLDIDFATALFPSF